MISPGSSIIATAISFKSLNMFGSIFGMTAGVVILIQQDSEDRNYNIHLVVAVLVSFSYLI